MHQHGEDEDDTPLSFQICTFPVHPLNLEQQGNIYPDPSSSFLKAWYPDSPDVPENPRGADQVTRKRWVSIQVQAVLLHPVKAGPDPDYEPVPHEGGDILQQRKILTEIRIQWFLVRWSIRRALSLREWYL